MDATPEQVWEAIATGPGIDSWFMGRNEIEPARAAVGTDRGQRLRHGGVHDHRVGAAHGWPTGATRPTDGSFMAFEFLIEGREAGARCCGS